MVKARFYIEDKVQDVGYRSFVIQKLLESPLKRGTARNLPDGRVEVLVDGKKKDIERLVETLKREKPELAENPTMSEIDYKVDAPVPEIMRSSQALVLEQFGKGVVVLKDMVGMNDKLGGMNDKLGGMNDKLGGMGQKMDSLPKRIAEELKKVI